MAPGQHKQELPFEDSLAGQHTGRRMETHARTASHHTATPAFQRLHGAALQPLDENSLTLLFEDHNGDTDHTMELSTK